MDYLAQQDSQFVTCSQAKMWLQMPSGVNVNSIHLKHTFDMKQMNIINIKFGLRKSHAVSYVIEYPIDTVAITRISASVRQESSLPNCLARISAILTENRDSQIQCSLFLPLRDSWVWNQSRLTTFLKYIHKEIDSSSKNKPLLCTIA